jgi:hypothetical protein
MPAVDVSGVEIPDPIPTGTNPSVVDWIRSIAKSLVATVLVAAGALLTILKDNQTLADVTFVNWLWILTFVILAGHAVWKVPNQTLP